MIYNLESMYLDSWWVIEDAYFRFLWHVSDCAPVSAPALPDQYTVPAIISSLPDHHSPQVASPSPDRYSHPWQLLSTFNNFYLLLLKR